MYLEALYRIVWERMAFLILLGPGFIKHKLESNLANNYFRSFKISIFCNFPTFYSRPVLEADGFDVDECKNVVLCLNCQEEHSTAFAELRVLPFQTLVPLFS
jgi:hypothetical protein